MKLLEKQSTLDNPKRHIVQANLDKKNLLINKYHHEISNIMEQLYPKKNTRRVLEASNQRKRALSSLNRQQKSQKNGLFNSIDDYSKLILGLELALENCKNKNDDLEERNLIIESELERVRKILEISDEQQKALFSNSQQQITYLEKRIIEQKKDHEHVLESKNEILTNMQKQIRILERSLNENKNSNTFQLAQRIIELTAEQNEMRHQMNKKNMIIQKLKCECSLDESSQNEGSAKNSKIGSKEKHYFEQMEISNKLIMRKNIEILSLSGKIVDYEKVLNVVELYLDKKQVRGVDVRIMEHPCINKLRMLLREKSVFEKQLLNQLNEHNKKFATIQNQLSERSNPERMGVIVNDNRRLTSTIINLQNTIGILEKQIDKTQKDNEVLKRQIMAYEQDRVQLQKSIKQVQTAAKEELNQLNKENVKLGQKNNELMKFLEKQKERRSS